MAYEKIQAAFNTEDCRTLTPATEQDLAEILTTHKIDYRHWGHGATKSVAQLLQEVKDRESSLLSPRDGSVLGRVLSVAAVDITTNVTGTPLRLVEELQVFRDGTERPRKLRTSLSEKVMGDETPELAAVRGIKEELGVAYDGLLTHVNDRLVVRESDSYPGLVGVYRAHIFAATFSEQEYNADGYVEVQPDKTTYFGWHPIGEIDS